MNFAGVLDLSKPLSGNEQWSLDPSLVSILGDKPLNYRMSPALEKIGAYLCEFLKEQLSMKLQNFQVCKTDPVLQNGLQSQLALKKILGALLRVANFRPEEITKSFVSVANVFDARDLTVDDRRKAYCALLYAIGVVADTISKIEFKKSAAEVKRLVKSDLIDTSDPSEKKRNREIPDVKSQVKEITKERKFLKGQEAPNKRRKLSQAPFRVSIHKDQFRPTNNNQTQPRDSNSGQFQTSKPPATRGGFRGRGRGKR